MILAIYGFGSKLYNQNSSKMFIICDNNAFVYKQLNHNIKSLNDIFISFIIRNIILYHLIAHLHSHLLLLPHPT